MTRYLTRIVCGYSLSMSLGQGLYRQTSLAMRVTLTGQQGAKSPGLQLQEARTEWAVTLKALRKTRSSAKVSVDIPSQTATETELLLRRMYSGWFYLNALPLSIHANSRSRHHALVQDSEETNNELSAMLAATPSAPGEERKYRHQRLLQKQVQEVHNSAKKLTSSQARLQHQVHTLTDYTMAPTPGTYLD
uniref:(California timema) hypothetical protein n=1 Tax=Timema californicum TaxID=61474 RepID=A0A7R9JK30_TIMCA|nr:unnamed protein product [Timema californicum]